MDAGRWPWPWTLEAQRDWKKYQIDPSCKSVRVRGYDLLKFIRKAFTEPDGRSVIKYLRITPFKSFGFPEMKKASDGYWSHRDWDLEDPRMSNFNWREYLGTFTPDELDAILEFAIFDVLVAYTVGEDDIFENDDFVGLKLAPYAGQYFLVFRRVNNTQVICCFTETGSKGKVFDGREWTIIDLKDTKRLQQFEKKNQDILVGVNPDTRTEFLYGGWREDRFRSYLVNSGYYQKIKDYIGWDDTRVTFADREFLDEPPLYALEEDSRQRQEAPGQQEAPAPGQQGGSGSQEGGYAGGNPAGLQENYDWYDDEYQGIVDGYTHAEWDAWYNRWNDDEWEEWRSHWSNVETVPPSWRQQGQWNGQWWQRDQRDWGRDEGIDWA